MAYQFESRVRYSETGMDRRLTLLALADYFQDCSIFHSEDCANGMAYLQEKKRAWMILSWQVDILRRPLLGERITVQTWPYGFKAFYGYRNFAMLDEKGQYLARANSVWVFMDVENGKPAKPAPEDISGYGMGERLDMEYSSRKMLVPEDCVRQESFTVTRHHLDTNHHVNNGQYISMAEEYLPAGFETARLQVEYRQQARLHDVIVPMTHSGEDGITVSLCSEEGKAYAIVRFIPGSI